MNGIATGKSNFTNYSWVPHLTLPMAEQLISVLGVNPQGHRTVLDFGCARGYLVRALVELGIDAYGYDKSKWAIENCDEKVKDRVSNTLHLDRRYTHVVSKDVLEHIEESELYDLIPRLWNVTLDSMFFIVPMTDPDGNYLREEDEADITHVIRWQMHEWMNFFREELPDATVWGSMHVHGLKPASEQVPWSTGFFRITR